MRRLISYLAYVNKINNKPAKRIGYIIPCLNKNLIIYAHFTSIGTPGRSFADLIEREDLTEVTLGAQTR